MDTSAPTSRPSVRPTAIPLSSTQYPTSVPTVLQTISTSLPTLDPVLPTPGPSTSSDAPTELPTLSPVDTSSSAPSSAPVYIPSEAPTVPPSWVPSFQPTYVPTYPITEYPSYAPDVISKDPTFAPTYAPTYFPTLGPSASIVTYVPSSRPTGIGNNNASTDSLSTSTGLSTPERTAVIVLSVLLGPMILACLIFAAVHYYGAYKHKKRLSKNGRQQEEEVIIVDHVGHSDTSAGAAGTAENEDSAVDCEQGMQHPLPNRVTSLTSSSSSFSSFMRSLRPDSMNTTGSTGSCQSSVIAPDENSASSSSSNAFGPEETKQSNMEEGIASVPHRRASGTSMISAAAASALARSFWGKSSHRVTNQQTVPSNQPQSLANSSSTHSHNTVDSPMIPVDLRSQSGHLGEEDYDGDYTQNFSSVYVGSRSDDYGTVGNVSSNDSGDTGRRPAIQRMLIEADDVGQPLHQLGDSGDYDTVA